jgi:tripartite-type tricarboxylate transporter receptor subunit TctC
VSQTIPGYAVESWYGLYAPAGTPASVIKILGASVAGAVKSPEFVKKVEYEGLTISVGTPQDLQSYVQGEQARWKKIVIENKIQVQ